MPDLTRVDNAHQQLHTENTALEQAQADEASAQATVAELERQLGEARAVAEQATQAREAAEARYNDACDGLSNESLAAKVGEETPATAAALQTAK